MPSTTTRSAPTTAALPLPAIARVLAGALAFLAIGGLQGGIAMLMNPETPLGMSTQYLDGTPFHSFVLPGLYLLAVGAAAGLTAIGIAINWRWQWAARLEQAIGYRWQWIGAVAVGLALLVLEVIELFTVPFHPILHPLMIAVGLISIGLPFTPSLRRRYETSDLDLY